MKLKINNKKPVFLISAAVLKKIFNFIIKDKTPSVINLNFIDDAECKTITKRTFKKAYITDVVAVNFFDENIFGEVYLNYEHIKRNSLDYGVSFFYEICFCFAHGLYHLLGYNDNTKRAREEMFYLQEQTLKKSGVKK